MRRCSVLIPTKDRHERLAECLAALACQTPDAPPFEILIGVDGPDTGERQLARTLIPESIPCAVLDAPARGPAATRNRILEHATADLVLLLNDDVVPNPDLVARHAQAHEQHGTPAMILGDGPWRIITPDRAIDRMVRQTSLVFFYDQMSTDDPDHDWGFRHAWTLNLSMPTDLLRDAGGFCEAMAAPVYEDIEMAFRVRERAECPVLYRPGAVAEHVHRYEPTALLRREIVLGHQAHHLASVSPRCARAIFGFDHRDESEIARARSVAAQERPDALGALRSWLALANEPASTLDDETAMGDALESYRAARAHLRRLGWIASADARSVGDAALALDELLETTAT